MATESPTSARCPAEPHTGQGAYLKFEITSVSDSDAATNKRYVSWKITFQGTPWVQLFKAYAKLGNTVIYNGEPGTTGWSVGTVLKSDTTTFDNDSTGNLTLAFYMKQLFYYGTWSWNQSGYAQEKNETFRFSQLPRYAAFTSHTATSELNKITVSYTSDVEYKAQQYSLNGGAWTNTTAGSYNLTGLTPNTSYTIKTKIQRADSNLWTESDTITIKTKALPTSIAPSDILFNKDGNTFTPSISSVDYLSGWYVIVKDGSTQVRSYSGTQSTTSSKTYTLQGSDFTAMLPRHTTTDNWNLTVQYKVISNGTTYTLTDRTFKCTIPAGQYLPIYNVNNLSYAVTDSKTLGLNNNNTTKVIKGVSSVKITSTAASPQGSASMSSYIASSGTKQKSGTTTTAPIEISLDNVDGSSFSVQAVDSRNRSTTATKNYAAFIDYFAPIVDSANITRVDAIGTNINVNIVGRYMNWSGLATSNTIEQVSIKYRIKGATSWTTKTGITFTRNVGNGNFTITGVITGNNFVATNEYELQLTFKDKIGDFIVLANIPVGDSLLWRDLANKRIGIGKKPEYMLDVGGDARVDGILYSKLFDGALSRGKIRLLPLTSCDTVPDATTDSQVYFKAFIKWLCNTYPNDVDMSYIGCCSPNSRGNILLHIYSNATKDATTGLPQHCEGIYISLGGSIYSFGTSSYTFYWKILANTNDINGRAPKSHASSGTTYGVGTASNYGHCRVINNLTTASATNGYALQAYQGKVLNDRMNNMVVKDITLSADISGGRYVIDGLDIVSHGRVYDIVILSPSSKKQDLNMRINDLNVQKYNTLVGVNIQDTGSSNGAANNEGPQRRPSMNNIYYGISLFGPPTIITGTLALIGNYAIFQYTATSAKNGAYYFISACTYLEQSIDNITSLTLNSGTTLPKGLRIIITKHSI